MCDSAEVRTCRVFQHNGTQLEVLRATLNELEFELVLLEAPGLGEHIPVRIFCVMYGHTIFYTN